MDGAGSTEVSDLNGFSNAEYRVYIRDRQLNIPDFWDVRPWRLVSSDY
jgi:hypothetical protein